MHMTVTKMVVCPLRSASLRLRRLHGFVLPGGSDTRMGVCPVGLSMPHAETRR